MGSKVIRLLGFGALENVLKSLKLLLGQVHRKRTSGLLGHLEELLKLLIIDTSLLVIGWRDIHAGLWREEEGHGIHQLALPIVLSKRSVRLSIP